MSNGVQIEWPKAEVDKLFAAMQYAAKTLDIEIGTAMKQAVRSLLNSMATSTKIAPKFREINERPEFVSATAKHWKQRESLPFAVTGWFGRPRTLQSKLVYAKDFATAKRRYATIANRGLARLTWRMVSRMVNQKIDGMQFPTLNAAIMNKVAIENVDGKANYKGSDIFAEIHNSLPYITSALQGGPQDVNTAFDRAARGLMQSVDKQLVRKMGLGKLS